jgi:SulP family sulfate permease
VTPDSKGTRRRRPALGDLIAGVSIAVLLVPQSLAYARVAGVPPFVGLHAAALPPLAAAFFASSPFLQTGPVAITAVLTAGALADLAVPGSPRFVALAALLALLVGGIRVLIGVLRLGRVVYLMSEPVLRGFTTGAAMLIIMSQVPALLGVQPTGGGSIRGFARALFGLRGWDAETIAIGVATFAVIVISRSIHALVPWAPIVTAGGIAYSMLTAYDGAVTGDIPGGFIPFSLDLPWAGVPSLLLPGLVIALVGFAEAASIARMFAAKERQHWEPDRDFVSQGVANIASAVSGGFPVGGSFSRSALGRLLGAKSTWSGAITGITVLAFLPLARILEPLPSAVLSAMVIAAVIGLVRFRPLLSMWPLSRPQFLVAGSTLLLTLLLSPRVDQAVVIGILFAIGVHVWREFDLKVASWVEDGAIHVRPEGVLWFGSAEVLKQETLELVAEHPDAQKLVLHMERVGRVDLTASLALELLIEQARSANLETDVRSIHPETARALRRVLTR